MKILSCRDAGENCNKVIRGNSKEEVLRKAADHVKRIHGMKDIGAEERAKMESLIKDEPSR